MMANCAYCKNCVSMRMANRLTVHLIDDHKLFDEEAYETVNWVFARLRDHLKGKS
jgi:shikimate kinase